MASPTRPRSRRNPAYIGPVMVVDPETGEETPLEVPQELRELFDLRDRGGMTEEGRRAGTHLGGRVVDDRGRTIYRW